MAKILLHTLVFSPDAVSTSYLMSDLASQLHKLGHELTVLTTTPHYNLDKEAIQRQPLKKKWGGLIFESEYKGVRVWHIKIPMKGQRVFTRMFDYLYFHFVALIFGYTVLGSYNIIITPSPPLTIGIVGWLLSLRSKCPFVYNIQEIYPDFAINQGLIKNQIFIKVLRWVERFVYSRSAKLVPISDWFSQIILQRNVPKEKIFVIPNFVDTELYKPQPMQNSFAKQYGLQNNFIVLYGGNVGLSQDWESFLFAAKELSHLPIQFVIVGNGARSEWLTQEVEKRGLHNVRLLGYQPRERMSEINAAADVCTIPMKASTTTDTFPSKIYTMLACAKPVIVQANENSELSWLIHQAQCGSVVQPDNPQAYADAVLHAYNNREHLAIEGERGRKFVEEEYSKEAIAHKYNKLIDELLVK